MLLYNASHRHDAVTNRQPSCRRRVLEWLNASHTGSEARVCGLAIELAVFRCGIVPSPPTPGKAGRDTGCIAPRTFSCVPESVLALPPAMAGFDRLRNRGSGLSWSALAALLAEAVDFQRLGLRPEAESPRLRLDQLGHPSIADLLRTRAAVADQERHLMRLGRMVAGDVGVDRLELVDETLLEKEIERAIDRGWRGVPVAFAQLIEQVVGLDRFARRGDKRQHFPAQGSEPQSALLAGLFDRRDETLGVFDVV